MRNLISSWKYLFPLILMIMSVVLPTYAQEKEEPAEKCSLHVIVLANGERAMACLQMQGSMTCSPCGVVEVIDPS